MEEKSLNFLEEIVGKYVAEGGAGLQTRFPPEPNGYLHIGHAKSICLNFGLAARYGGKCNLRFDDTNPAKEDTEYVDSIKADIRWLGFDWALERYASDYFEQLYDWAVELIRKGLAYVDDQTQEQIRVGRGTVTSPGTASPWRERGVEENLELFARMRAGEFPDGARVLRARIDMAHPNMMFRDPILYRILHTAHHRTGDKWCIYPMYDFAHGQSDSIERITHSICTLEFAVHRPLYDWFIEQLGIFPSRQYEFARLNLTYTMMSKRKLLQLVDSQIVSGWDDPRMPTISGMRRRGYTPTSIRAFAERVGVAKRDNVIDLGLLEYCVREDLNRVAQRRMAVMNPLKVVITNWEDASTTGVASADSVGGAVSAGASASTGSVGGTASVGASASTGSATGAVSAGASAPTDIAGSSGVAAGALVSGANVPRGTNAPAPSSTSSLSEQEGIAAGSPRVVPAGRVEMIRCVNNPEDESAGTREVPLTREIYIERDDFMEEPPKKFFRLSPGGEVRLRYGYLIRCDEVVKAPSGEIVELRCTYDPLSGGGGSSDGRRVKGVIHWVSAHFAVPAEARLYNPLFTKEDPEDVGDPAASPSSPEGLEVSAGSAADVPRGTTPALTSRPSEQDDDTADSLRPLPLPRGTTGTFLDNLNPESLVRARVLMEPSLAEARVGETFQFERVGYFCVDPSSTPAAPVFNRTVTLKDSWAKQQ